MSTYIKDPSLLKHHISSIIYFCDLPSDDLDRLCESILQKSYEANEILFLEGNKAEGIWVIESGHVKISKVNAQGNEHILHILGKGQSFNDIATLDGGTNPADAIALSSVNVWFIPRHAICYLLQTNADFALSMVQTLAKRIRGLVGKIEDLALYSVIVRLSRFLLKQANDPSLYGHGVTRTAIAAYLATTPQTISNVLRELEDLGAIEFDRHRVCIIDEPKLEEIAML